MAKPATRHEHGTARHGTGTVRHGHDLARVPAVPRATVPASQYEHDTARSRACRAVPLGTAARQHEHEHEHPGTSTRTTRPRNRKKWTEEIAWRRDPTASVPGAGWWSGPRPCRPLERAVPVPCCRVRLPARARARGRPGRAIFGPCFLVPCSCRPV